ncbi:hypothetical protein GCM10012275_19940 [Longimycelium tulufanense]|uniref:HTTM-like domain-containing protein n=1 Tax=Longimycelium tulufanense TaxID=907463 RepID=A0A8J3FTF0_9PSEU|nr:HTTM domain-containing protein [Longimycelium tulufanense]GGM49035.1 hypothetical protein GCM10012275_19940 [Longimycelium tulufanense]
MNERSVRSPRLSTPLWRGLSALTEHRRALLGAALTRICLGAVGVYCYLREYGHRGYLWGPDGVWPWDNLMESVRTGSYGAYSLYAVSRSEWWFELVFHLGALFAILFTLGWRTRLMTVLHGLFIFSLQQRNPAILDGGDNLAHLLLIYLVFVDSGRRLSLDNWFRSRKTKPAPNPESLRHRLGSLLHHAGLFAVIAQICIVYLVSGMYKVQGPQWQDGSALYYVLRLDEFAWPGVSSLVYQHAFLVALITYATVFFQLAFPFLLVHRPLRLPLVATSILFHLGIGVLMSGLLPFSLVMIAAELVVMGDDHYRTIVAGVRGVLARAGAWSARRVERTAGQR